MSRKRYNVVVNGEEMRIGLEKPSDRKWRDLYLAVLFEGDSAKLPKRIAEAEHAMSLRDRELWYSGGDNNSEKQALNGAMRALEALRSIHLCPRTEPQVRSDVAGSRSDCPPAQRVSPPGATQ